MSSAHGENHLPSEPRSAGLSVVGCLLRTDEQTLLLHRQSRYTGDHAVSSSRSSCISAKIPAGGTMPFSVT